MSGDLGPRVAICAAQKFVTQFSDVDVLLIGDEPSLISLLAKNPVPPSRVSVLHAADIVAMNDDPLHALRHKKHSSMWLALEQLRLGVADACVSAGNTGALMAMGKFLVKTFPGLERPAICKSMPGEKGKSTYLLDLGANVNCDAEHLYQFARMGNLLAKAKGIENPQVALLNLGTEEQKGTDVLREARQLLKTDNHIRYAGFVEADAIYEGVVDVIVCDGFHGNIALKASEGVARFIRKKILKTTQKNGVNKILALLAWPLLKQLRLELDPALYNGASLLGLQKTVVKSHGNADTKAFLQALTVAREQVLQQVPQLIQKEFLSH